MATAASCASGVYAHAGCLGLAIRLVAITLAWLAAAYGATRRQADETRMWTAAVTDPLTGLPNRALLMDHLQRELRRREPCGPISVGFVDLDDFKRVNDSYGHAVGDALLVEIGRRLLAGVRSGDLVARFGGDEFALVCVSVGDTAAADQLCARLLGSVRLPIPAHHMELRPRATIGMVVALERGMDAEELLDAADLAMFGARRAGRQQLTVDFEQARRRPLAPTGKRRRLTASIA